MSVQLDQNQATAVSVPLLAPSARPTRVTLVRPPVVVMAKSLAIHGPVPPIGLAYVAAFLEGAGHEVQVVDGAGEAIKTMTDFESPVGTLRRVGLSPEEIVARIDPDTRVIGITNMFLHEWPQVREIADLARERFPAAFIMLGGENATSFREWIMEECPAIDACVLGEGEATALEVVNRVSAGLSLEGLEGLVARDPSATATNDGGLTTRLRKLDEVPRPAWHLIPLDGYWSHDPYFGVNRGKSIPVLATRGCPYQCTFCSSPQMWTTRYVVREPDDVADEIADYVSEYGVKNINFCDLTAITKRKWTLRFCDALAERVPGISWQLPVGTRAEALDEEVLQRLWDTGCRNITYAPESGSDRMLKIMNKKVDLNHILESLSSANKIGLRTHVNIIIGHPAETWKDVRASMRFLLKAVKVGCDDAAVIMFCPYPGSVDFRALLDSGELVIDESAYYLGLSRSSSAHKSYNSQISSRQLRFLQLGMLCMFYGLSMLRRPKRILTFLRSQLTGNEDTYLDQMVRTRRREAVSSLKQLTHQSSAG